jgi:hypothetical protein
MEAECLLLLLLGLAEEELLLFGLVREGAVLLLFVVLIAVDFVAAGRNGWMRPTSSAF